MTRLFTASVLSVAIATAPISSMAAPAIDTTAPAVAPDWARQPAAPEHVVAEAVKEAVAEIKLKEDAEASATRHDTYNVYRHRQNGQQKFETMFADSKVPGCLQPDGLKRQSTLIFGGLLALPFIAVAALRGKCN